MGNIRPAPYRALSIAPAPLLLTLCTQLQHSPVEAVESAELLELYHFNPTFYEELPAPDRWRLLFGLAISLLDYSNSLNLETHFLPLPGNLEALSLWQVCDALVCIDFQLDGLDWAEELQSPLPLSIAQLEACEATLSAPETMDQLNRLISEALVFMDDCDDYPLTVTEATHSNQGLLWRVWTGLRACLPGHAKAP